MVRSIERVLGAPLERRHLDDFNYQTPAPRRDTEFSRPPRPANRNRRPAGPAKVQKARPTWSRRKPANASTAHRRSNHRARPAMAASA
jgi:ATP-dependent RNA helicase RhlE